MANLMMAPLATVVWEIMNCLPCSPDLAPSDLNFFGSVKVHLGGQNFQTDNKLKHSVLNWLHSQDKTFYAVDVSNLPGQF
jgi:hypothetical protein